MRSAASRRLAPLRSLSPVFGGRGGSAVGKMNRALLVGLGATVIVLQGVVLILTADTNLLLSWSLLESAGPFPLRVRAAAMIWVAEWTGVALVQVLLAVGTLSALGGFALARRLLVVAAVTGVVLTLASAAGAIAAGEGWPSMPSLQVADALKLLAVPMQAGIFHACWRREENGKGGPGR